VCAVASTVLFDRLARRRWGERARIGTLWLAAASVAGWLSPTLLLVGLFLFWAGIVKVVVVALWRHLGSNPGVASSVEG